MSELRIVRARRFRFGFVFVFVVVALAWLGACEGMRDRLRADRPPEPCAGDEPIPRTGAAGTRSTGLSTCDGGLVHRVDAPECQAPVRAKGSCVDGRGACTTDADCTERPHGLCEGVRNSGCHCEYGCQSDADCAADELCDCFSPTPTCVQAYCRTDADCQGEYKCVRTETGVYACHSPRDACRDWRECEFRCGSCAYDRERSHLVCRERHDCDD